MVAGAGVFPDAKLAATIPSIFSRSGKPSARASANWSSTSFAASVSMMTRSGPSGGGQGTGGKARAGAAAGASAVASWAIARKASTLIVAPRLAFARGAKSPRCTRLHGACFLASARRSSLTLLETGQHVGQVVGERAVESLLDL